ncbi:hypothetical protein EKO23_19500 [Nocardioides guangzhouensis]|uniref:DUF6504 domain-containing protein n=1 Tax=Nocardioides guangzhouensis TaxID=2497878 RepID=A0A4Q4Z7I0_9ACTN|nr:DUF6504 family protein [Nocardioides guangzhouensis]RYP83355.1 hypothetical protein EKO23_19500 [Nocardioides guangzhouensis]
MRRYDDPVEVRKGMVGSQEAPEQFLWRGRLWKVRDVLAHWVETGPWWQSSGVRAVVGTDDAFAEEPSVAPSPVGHDLLAEREMWRVEAGAGMTSAGVFDLSFSWSDGHWQLVGCAD